MKTNPWDSIELSIDDAGRLDWLDKQFNRTGLKTWKIVTAKPKESIREAIDDTIKFQKWQTERG